MPPTSMMRAWMAAFLAASLSPGLMVAQGATGDSIEVSQPAGANYDKANFRFWAPKGNDAFQAVVVLVPGSNGDGRAMVQDSAWQSFATRHHLALVGCQFTDKPHDQGFIEEYVDVSRGTGQALVDALARLGTETHHAELARVPLFLWGMSAGGEFDYEFVAWKPERVAAFVVNKGGIYYSALVSRAAREVPGLLFVGEKDLAFRTNTITGLFAVNRRAGALWALTTEPGLAHVVGRSRDLGIMFFEDVLALRLRPDAAGNGPVAMTPLAEWSGYLGDLTALTVAPMGDGRAPAVPTAWLPTERMARAWQAVVSGKPFVP